MVQPDVVTVNIRSMAVGGAGVGEVVSQASGEEHLLGITAFVPFASIGELVVARVTEQKPRYVHAELVEIERPSSERIEPECPYFTSCGGCELQHINYAAQLQAKTEMIRGALRAGRLTSRDIDLLKPVSPSSSYHYRRRVSLHIDSSGNVGFYRANSRSVVPISSCAVSIPQIDSALEDIFEFGRAVAGKVSSLLLDADDEGIVAVMKAPFMLGAVEQKEVLLQAKKHFPSAALLVGEKEVCGFGRKILELPLNDAGTLTLRVPAGSFSQVNWGVNRELLAEVVRHSGVVHGTRAADLYAGAGNFTLPLGHAGAKVTAVESAPQLVMFGRQNAERYQFGRHVNFVESSVEAFLRKSGKDQEFDVLVADPPRSGLGGIIPDLPRAKTLVLISCHLPSFVRDAKALIAEGWELQTISPFDMFPQTSFVEIMSVYHRCA